MLVLGGIIYSVNNGSTITAENTVVAATSTPVEVAPSDPLEEARHGLSKITETLNQEVSAIEAQKASLNAEIEALDQRLEEIRKLRTSF